MRRLALLLALALAACSGGGDPGPAGDVTLQVLSNRADLVSDGNAYMEVVVPPGSMADDLKVDVDGTDVTSAFARRPNGRILGVVTGLKVGANTVTARLAGVNKGARLVVTNTARGGPIFSGPQLQPWICATKAGSAVHVTVPGTSLAASVPTAVNGLDSDPVDAQCNTPTKYDHYYKPASKAPTCTVGITGTDPCFVPYDPAARPADALIADFTNDRGDRVKALVRLESGVIDRGSYVILSYFDPAQASSPWSPQKGWNGKLLYRFGAAASGNRFQYRAELGGLAGPDWIWDHNALARGFMVAAGSLTNHLDNNNEVLAAEQMMMIKEHIIDTYGEIRYTMGEGASGGSMMQTGIASVMPGLLQGLLTGVSYPDAISTWIETRDCALAAEFYKTSAGSAFTADQRTAIEGHPSTHCPTWVASFLLSQKPTVATNCAGLGALIPNGLAFPASLVYDPVLRPQGVRCSIHDVMGNIFGTVMESGRVVPKLPYDNVGVQYGLKALASGAITPEQFVRLNEAIGAYDTDLNWTGGLPAAPVVPAPRFRAAGDNLAQIYQSGLVANGRNLAKVAIIDSRPEWGVDFHMTWRSAQTRARLDAANGGHANHVIRGSASARSSTGFAPALADQSFGMMDRWLAAVEADASTASLESKIVSSRPADVRDGCFAGKAETAGEVAVELRLTDPACPIAASLRYSSPRQVAGGPRGEDVFQCQLKPFDAASADHGGAVFTPGQASRLAAVFPDGVCNWNLPGVGQATPWALTSFRSGPGGARLPSPPVSTPF